MNWEKNHRLHFYAVSYASESLFKGQYKTYFKSKGGFSSGEYRMDLEDSQDKIDSFKAFTHSIHAYGDLGRSPGLASLFKEGPRVLVEEKKKKKKKTERK